MSVEVIKWQPMHDDSECGNTSVRDMKNGTTTVLEYLGACSFWGLMHMSRVMAFDNTLSTQ